MHTWRSLIAVLAASITVCVGAAADAAPTASTLEWRITAPTNWVGDGREPVAFLNVATNDAGQIYVANFSGVLIYDTAAGSLRGVVVDATRTVLQYDDVEPTSDGSVWVADSKSFNVYLLDPAGTVLRTIPSASADHPDGMHPNELEIGPDGNLYVMYSSASTVMQVFTPEGAFVRSFGMGDSKFSTGLIDFAFGPDGNLYIAGYTSLRVLDPEGNLVVEDFAPDFTAGSTAGLHGIAVDPFGNVYVGGNALAADGSLVAAVYQLDAAGEVGAQFGRAQQRINWAPSSNRRSSASRCRSPCSPTAGWPSPTSTGPTANS